MHPQAGREAEELRFESGGERCAAWLFRPAESAAAPAPCVVLGSGASCVYDQGLALYAERFAAAGVRRAPSTTATSAAAAASRAD